MVPVTEESEQPDPAGLSPGEPSSNLQCSAFESHIESVFQGLILDKSDSPNNEGIFGFFTNKSSGASRVFAFFNYDELLKLTKIENPSSQTPQEIQDPIFCSASLSISDENDSSPFRWAVICCGRSRARSCGPGSNRCGTRSSGTCRRPCWNS